MKIIDTPTRFSNENEKINNINKENLEYAKKNIDASLHNNMPIDGGINAILKFLNEKELVDPACPIEEQIKYVKEKMPYYIRNIVLDPDWNKNLAIPMLVKTTEGEWLAVIPYSVGTCVYIKNGRKIKVTQKNLNLFTTEAMSFCRVFGSGKVRQKDVLKFMFKSASTNDKILVVIFSAIATLAGMLLPAANRYIFSNIIPSGEATGVYATISLIFSAVTVMITLKILQSLILTNSMVRISSYIQTGIFQRLMSLELDFFRKSESGKLVQSIVDAADVSGLLSAKNIAACIGVGLSFFYFAQIHIFAPEMIAVVILITIILGILILIEGRANAKWTEDYVETLSDMSGFVYEMFSGIEQIKLNGAEYRTIKRWSKKYLNAALKEDKPFILRYAPVFYRLIMLLSTLTIYFVGVKLPAADYIAFAVAYGAYVMALMNLPEVIIMISKFHALLNFINPMLEEDCKINDRGEKLQEIKGAIIVSDVKFRYSDETPFVIDGLNFIINKGESIGIIGKSGCGKSTLIRLLLGFENFNEGSIYIDGFDIRELDLQYLRKKIGTVIQGSGLISGDIYSNITITKPDATWEEVSEVIELSGLTQDIDSFPMGVRTPVNNENCTLSGGQKQRILIARALINKPEVLIFDEATSALDNVSQSKVTQSVNNLQCTKIIIAHRLSTIEHCDRVFVMDKGKIVAEGTFDELKHKNAYLMKNIQRQIV